MALIAKDSDRFGRADKTALSDLASLHSVALSSISCPFDYVSSMGPSRMGNQVLGLDRALRNG